MVLGRISGAATMPSFPAGIEVPTGRFVKGFASFFKLIDFGTLPNAATKSIAHGIAAALPGSVKHILAEHILAAPTKGVPITDGETEMIFHAFSEQLAVGIVKTIGQRIS